MGFIRLAVLLLVASVSTLTTAKPIMVTFGTNNGSITPLDTTSPHPINPNRNFSKVPAPIYEITDDIPNPNTYRPFVPNQYRTKIYSYNPKPNLILGTPIDQKYIPSIEKLNIYRKQQIKSIGKEYTGPHLFEVQPYEFESKKLKPTVRTRPQQLFQPAAPAPQAPPTLENNNNNNNNAPQNNKYVPQIGVLYSSGVRYYVPQIFDYDDQSNDSENSVYDKDDVKHVIYRPEQKY